VERSALTRKVVGSYPTIPANAAKVLSVARCFAKAEARDHPPVVAQGNTMYTNIAKIDFMICLRDNSWYVESQDVPAEIAARSSEEITAWAVENFYNRVDIFWVGVYWRDPNIDEISKENPLN
jgi:hypothetical protein